MLDFLLVSRKKPVIIAQCLILFFLSPMTWSQTKENEEFEAFQADAYLKEGRSAYSLVSTTLGLDSEGSGFLAFDGAVPVDDHIQLDLGFSRTRTDTNPAFSTVNYILGFTVGPGRNLEGGASYTLFGNFGQVSMHRFDFSLIYRNSDFSIGFAPSVRALVTNFTRPKTGELASRTNLNYGLGLNLQYTEIDPLIIGFSGNRYLYTQQIRTQALEKASAIGIISNSTFSVISGMLLWDAQISGGVAFETWSTTATYGLAKSFVDGTRILTLGLGGGWYPFENWAFHPEIGSYKVEGSSSAFYAQLAVSYSW